MENEFRKFLSRYESKVVSLSEKLSIAYFDATISGKKEDYALAADLQFQLSKIYSDKDDFALLNSFKKSNDIQDPFLKRQLELIYNDYASNQFDEKLMEKIINLSTRVEEKFSTFRVNLSGRELTDNQIDELLIQSTDSGELENAWTASKEIGKVVVDDVIKLVEMRNESAQMLGFPDYYEMSLTLSEQNTQDMETLFDELDNMTRGAYEILKNEIDEYLSKRFAVPQNKLMPWHYQDRFFQQGPKIYKVDLDSYFKDRNIVELTKSFYNNTGLDIDDLIKKSDLFEKEGKYQHAYCTNINRQGDIRVVCNIKPNARWMSTMLHEFGHAAYDKFADQSLPWELRTHAHIFTTEAIAMYFGRFTSNAQWLRSMLNISSGEADKIAVDCFNSFRLEQLVFSRWAQVLFRFEKSMYANPGQDLNKLWWDLVEKYQMLTKPEGRNEPDWASKIHVALYPAYYHNYMLGELLASQINYCLLKNIVPGGKYNFSDNRHVGTFLKNNIFKYGASLKWNELIKKATGDNLSPKYYAMQILGEK